VRDQALGRPLVDLDVVLPDPEAAARAFARRSGGSPFPLSERHGAWRVALDDGGTVDFTPLPGSIVDDLATRDFTLNAIAERVGSDEIVDPYDGYSDLATKRLRAVSDAIFRDDPLRLLRGPRLEDELGLRLVPETEAQLRRDAPLVARPSGERILSELRRLSFAGFRRLEELGLLAPLGGSLARLRTADPLEDPNYRLVVVFGRELERLPISNELRRFARTLLAAKRPPADARGLHRFRRATEPWALEALAFLGASDLSEPLLAARRSAPRKPLLRGGELGLPPGPEVGRLLEEIEEERAAGRISTKEEALEYARHNTGAVRGER
jgi:tRNA nucleotidyltransferase/poly(A) polymerase